MTRFSLSKFSLSKFLPLLIALCLCGSALMPCHAQAVYVPLPLSDPALSAALSQRVVTPPASQGIYLPVLSASMLASSSGAFATGTGVAASVAGTAASGYINLPQAIDPTRPWRFAALVSFGGDTTNALEVQLQNPNDPYFTGIDWQINHNNGIQVQVPQVGQVVGRSLQAGLTSGQSFWFFATSDGVTVTAGTSPAAGPAPFNPVPATLSTVVVDSAPSFAATATSTTGGHAAIMADITRIYISNACATNKVLGVMFSQGVTGGISPAFQPPAVFLPTIYGDNTIVVRVPPSYTGLKPADVVFIAHGNTGAGSNTMDVTCFDGGAGAAALVAAGYIVVVQQGDPGATTNPSATSSTAPGSSGWGAGVSIVRRKATLDWVRSTFPSIRNVYWIGDSMGCLDGMNFALAYPGYLKALVGLSGVSNLTAAYNGANGGANFTATVNAAYVTAYVSLTAANTGNALSAGANWKKITAPGGVINTTLYPGTNKGVYAAGTAYNVGDIALSPATTLAQVQDHDPTLQAANLATLPIALWHGDTDTTIPIAQSAAFVSAMAAVGVTVPLTTVVGGGHLNSAASFPAAAVIAFFQSKQ